MTSETMVKIQCALNWLSIILDPKKNNHSSALADLKLAKEALAAEPDESTISNSVEDVAMEIMVKTEKWMAQDYDFSIQDASKLIQQFLDAQIAERDKRLNEQEDELDRIKSCSEGILLRMEGKYLDGISKIQIKSFIEKRGTL